MRPLLVVWPYALAFWIVFAGVFWPEFRLIQLARKLPTGQDAGSMRVILIGGRIAGVAALLMVVIQPAAAMAVPMVCYAAGVVAILAGGLLRRHCFRMLGPRFTGAVVVTADQAVIERGAYRWVRHPSYTAGMLLMTGLGLALGNWGSLIVLLLGGLAVYAYRVSIEERALTAVLGDAYRAHMRRTKRFIPLVI